MKDIQHLTVAPQHGIVVDNARGIKRFLYKVLPRHTLVPLFYELTLLLVRLTSRNAGKQYRGQKDLLLNLGAGRVGFERWVNVDSFRGKNIDCVSDIRKKLPFDNASVRGIFCEHFLEHLDYTEEVPHFLSECYRVLKPGGVIRIIVPDAEKYLRGYAAGGWKELSRVRKLSEGQRDPAGFSYNTRMELVNEIFRQGGQHKFAYDGETLEFLLRRYGFQGVKKQEYLKSLMPELCIDQEGRASESVYVEGQK
jgi:predicted SAM-dependent methyltransferase